MQVQYRLIVLCPAILFISLLLGSCATDYNHHLKRVVPGALMGKVGNGTGKLATGTEGRRCGGRIKDGDSKTEPLMCSGDWLTGWLIAAPSCWLEDEHCRKSAREQFRQACIRHDYCYRHGQATYGFSREDCDEQLGASMLKLCKSINRKEKVHWCDLRAHFVHAGVRIGGQMEQIQAFSAR